MSVFKIFKSPRDVVQHGFRLTSYLLSVRRMCFLLRFVKLWAAFLKIQIRVSAGKAKCLPLSSRNCIPLPSSLAAVHRCACRGVRSSFAVSSRKLHCRLSLVNDNQTVIILLSLLNVFCIFRSSLRIALILHSMHYHWPMYRAFTKSSITRSHRQKARKSKNQLWNWQAFQSCPSLLVHID